MSVLIRSDKLSKSSTVWATRLTKIIIKTISAICEEYGIKQRGGALQVAAKEGKLGDSARMSGQIWLIDDESEVFKQWLAEHWEHPRTKLPAHMSKSDKKVQRKYTIRKEEAEYTDTLPYGKRGKFVSDAIKAAIEEKKEVTQ